MLPLSNFLTNCLDNSTLFSKFLLVKSLGTHRAQTWLIFKSGNKMSCTEVFKTLKHFSATSRTVSRQSPSIMSWTSFSRLCNFEMMFLHGFFYINSNSFAWSFLVVLNFVYTFWKLALGFGIQPYLPPPPPPIGKSKSHKSLPPVLSRCFLLWPVTFGSRSCYQLLGLIN